MAAPFWILILLVMLLMTVALVVLIVVMAVRAGQGASRTSPYDDQGVPFESVPTALHAARRRAATTAGLAWVAAGGAAFLSPVLVALAARIDEVGVWCAALLVALAFLAVHAVAEGTWPRPSGAARRAPLVVRSVRQVAASWPRRMAWVWASCVVVVAVVCAVVADETGRGLTVQADEGWGRATPFPGLPHGVGALITVALVLAGTEVVLRQITQRRAVPDVSVADDLALRKLAARRVAAGSQAVVAGVLVVLLAVAGAAMKDVGTPTPGAEGGDAGVLFERWAVAGNVVTAAAIGVALAALAVAWFGSLRSRPDAHAVAAAHPSGAAAL